MPQKSTPPRTADRIVKKIVEDLSDRRGLRQEWEQIDRDIQREIMRKWRKIVRDAIAEPQR